MAFTGLQEAEMTYISRLTSHTTPSYQAYSPLLLLLLLPPSLPCCHGYTLSSLEMRNGRWKGEWENERGESEERRQRWWECREVKMEAWSVALVESVKKEVRTLNKYKNTLLCFPFFDNKSLQSIVIFIIQSQPVYLPIADRDRF